MCDDSQLCHVIFTHSIKSPLEKERWQPTQTLHFLSSSQEFKADVRNATTIVCTHCDSQSSHNTSEWWGTLNAWCFSKAVFLPPNPETQQPAASYNVTQAILSVFLPFFCLSINSSDSSAVDYLATTLGTVQQGDCSACSGWISLSVVEIKVFGLLVTWNIFICLCRTFAFCSCVSDSRGRDAPFLNANNVSSSRFINKTWGGSFRHSRVTANTHWHDCCL